MNRRDALKSLACMPLAASLPVVPETEVLMVTAAIPSGSVEAIIAGCGLDLCGTEYDRAKQRYRELMESYPYGCPFSLPWIPTP